MDGDRRCSDGPGVGFGRRNVASNVWCTCRGPKGAKRSGANDLREVDRNRRAPGRAVDRDDGCYARGRGERNAEPLCAQSRCKSAQAEERLSGFSYSSTAPRQCRLRFFTLRCRSNGRLAVDLPSICRFGPSTQQENSRGKRSATVEQGNPKTEEVEGQDYCRQPFAKRWTARP